MVTAGQLAVLGQLFYGRLDEIRAPWAPGWPSIARPASAMQSSFTASEIVNAGQAKHLFAALDGDRHLHPDLANASTNPTDFAFGLAWLHDNNEDGLLDFQQVAFYNGHSPWLTIVSGAGQIVAHDQPASAPVIIRAVEGFALPLVDQPVTFFLSGGSDTQGGLAANPQGPWQTSLTVFTDGNGEVAVWWQAPGAGNTGQRTLTATAVVGGLPLNSLEIPLLLASVPGTDGAQNPGTGPQPLPAMKLAQRTRVIYNEQIHTEAHANPDYPQTHETRFTFDSWEHPVLDPNAIDAWPWHAQNEDVFDGDAQDRWQHRLPLPGASSGDQWHEIDAQSTGHASGIAVGHVSVFHYYVTAGYATGSWGKIHSIGMTELRLQAGAPVPERVTRTFLLVMRSGGCEDYLNYVNLPWYAAVKPYERAGPSYPPAVPSIFEHSFFYYLEDDEDGHPVYDTELRRVPMNDDPMVKVITLTIPKGGLRSQSYTVDAAHWGIYDPYAYPLNKTTLLVPETGMNSCHLTDCFLIPVEIETLTFATEPPNRDRKKLGIGEEVKLSIKTPSDAVAMWALKSGDHGEVIKPLGYGPSEALFIASETEQEATIEATLTNYGNAKVAVTFDVIRPKTISFEKVGGQGIFWDANSNGIRMELKLDWYFGPDEVCFYAVEAGETGTLATVNGWFDKPEHQGWYANMHHEEWIGNEVLRRPPMPPLVNHTNTGELSMTVVQGKGTKCIWSDTATGGALPTSGVQTIDTIGRFEWPIKWKWRLKGKTGPGTIFAPATQWFEIEEGSTDTGNGTIQFQGKGGKGDVTTP